MRLLIIEDDDTIREILEESLKNENKFTIQTVATVAEAKEAVKNFCPEVILMDLLLDGIIGYEIIDVIHEKCPKTKVVAISALGNLQRICSEMKINHYIPKPFDYETLLEKLLT